MPLGVNVPRLDRRFLYNIQILAQGRTRTHQRTQHSVGCAEGFGISEGVRSMLEPAVVQPYADGLHWVSTGILEVISALPHEPSPDQAQRWAALEFETIDAKWELGQNLRPQNAGQVSLWTDCYRSRQ